MGTPSCPCQLLHGRALQGAVKCPHHPQCGSVRYWNLCLSSSGISNTQHLDIYLWDGFQHYKGGVKTTFVSEKLTSFCAIDSRCLTAWSDNTYKKNLFKTNNSFSTKWLFFLFIERAPTFQFMGYFHQTFQTVNSKYIFIFRINHKKPTQETELCGSDGKTLNRLIRRWIGDYKAATI